MIASPLACLSIEWLNTSYTVSYVMAAVSFAITLGCFVVAWRRNAFSWLILGILLLLCQPAWQLAWGEMLNGSRAASGDCGFGKRGESVFLTAVLAAILLIQIRGNVSKRSFIFRVTIACWALHAFAFILSRSQLLNSALFAAFPPDMGAQVFGTIEAGSGNVILYTIVLTLCCAVLYWIERRRRRLQSVATAAET
jgi:hypothetical protein